jgi:hypothetical protein
MTILPQFFADLETEMAALAENEFAAASRKVWWPLCMKRRPSRGKKSVLAWLLSTARLHDESSGLHFEELAQQLTEIEPSFSGAGLNLKRNQLEDVASDGEMREGVDLALAWAEQIGGSIAYWPQRHAAKILRDGHLDEANGGFNAYDGKAFFAADHDLNPYRPELGTYSNLLTGATYRIDAAVSIDDARDNLGAVFGAIGAIKMPHGDDFRCLRPLALLLPPTIAPRGPELTGVRPIVIGNPGEATLVDQVQAMHAAGFVTPVHVSELSGFEDETTYYVVCEQVDASQLGAMLYLERSPYAITYFGTGAKLDRMHELEWHVRGRNKIATGHPFLLFKVTQAA